MSRKDYELIVRVLNKHSKHLGIDVFLILVENFCIALKEDNPRFDKEKFMNALLNGD